MSDDPPASVGLDVELWASESGHMVCVGHADYELERRLAAGEVSPIFTAFQTWTLINTAVRTKYLATHGEPMACQHCF